jgi:hypothetical protein
MRGGRNSDTAASRAGSHSRLVNRVDLGPVGYFRIRGVRGADPIVLAAEPVACRYVAIAVFVVGVS